MFIKRGVIYTAPNSMVRVISVYTDNDGVKMVSLANLNPPGGRFFMKAEKFEAAYQEGKVDWQEPVREVHKKTTDPKYKSQKHNHYSPDFVETK